MNRSGSLLLLPAFLEAYRVANLHHLLPPHLIETVEPLSVSSLARIHFVRVLCFVFDVALFVQNIRIVVAVDFRRRLVKEITVNQYISLAVIE